MCLSSERLTLPVNYAENVHGILLKKIIVK